MTFAATSLARAREYGLSISITLAATALALPLHHHVYVINIVMIYVLAAAFAGLRLGRWPSALTAVLNIIAFDFFFVPPLYTLMVAPPSYFPTFATMLIVALIIANLMITVRAQTEAAAIRERHTAALYAIARELLIARDAEAMIGIATRHIAELLHCHARVLLCDQAGQVGGANTELKEPHTRPAVKLDVARWVALKRERAGMGATEFAAESARYLPLPGAQATIGVLVIESFEASPPLSVEQQRLLEAIADQLAMALERARMSERAHQAQLEAERAALRNTLLASISHDLRTPLSAIAGAGSMVAQADYALDVYRRVTLGQMIEDTARDMTELLSNVLELMRLESGRDAIRRDWESVQDLVGVALRRSAGSLDGRELAIDLPADLPLIAVDANLIVQLLSNLLDNAGKYTPAGTRITLAARRGATALQLSVEDDGPGLRGVAVEHLFEEFAAGQLHGRAGGVGLGLAICRAIVRLHGGDIRAGTASGGGARFEVTLPITADAERTEALEMEMEMVGSA
jgi:two-component system sensor histidine kinase KdpD